MGTVAKHNKKTKRKAISSEIKLERDLKDCMRCRYFYGNNNQCIMKHCVKEEKKLESVNTECTNCPYGKGHGLCFPCMKKILSK